jgi:hydrogenase expression/formation protein HypC
MCLGVPGKVLDIDGLVATVDVFGIRKHVRLDIVDAPVAPGDYVLAHVGFAVRRIPSEEIGEMLALYESLVRIAAEQDLMAEDVRNELGSLAPTTDSADFAQDVESFCDKRPACSRGA